MTADVAVQTSIYTSVNSIYPTKRNKWLESACETKIDKNKGIKYKQWIQTNRHIHICNRMLMVLGYIIT